MINFSAPKTILLGDNAQGKSNVLEAIELLSTLKSHRVSRDRDLIYTKEEEGRIDGKLERQYGLLDLSLVLRNAGRRIVKVNQENLRRQLDFLGLLNTVQFSSLDIDLVRGAPEVRRNWLDDLLSQIEPVYAGFLQEYHRVLKQRNNLLKRGLDEPISLTELELWDYQLVTTGTRVIRRRDRIIERLTPIAQEWHRNISNDREKLIIKYAPSIKAADYSIEAVSKAFFERINQRRSAEQNLGNTLVGPHRDDVELIINQTLAKTYASQGQQRTLVLALKLAQLHLIEEIVGESPLLLLDDVLAELDLQRQNQLLKVIGNRFQTLITTTHLGLFDRQWLDSSDILNVVSGHIQQDYLPLI